MSNFSSNQTRECLLDKILNEPFNFNKADFEDLIKTYYNLQKGKYDVSQAFNDIRECIKRIYNINENRLKDISNANHGRIGEFNRYVHKRRMEQFYQNLEDQTKGKKFVRIYAEGDSWFQFPFSKDIVNWLSKKENFLI